MSQVTLNKIEISTIDYDAINSQYDFYLIENHKENFKPDARIFDDSLASENVLAVQYTRGPSFILMMKKDRMNEATIAEIIKNARNEDNDVTKTKLVVPFEKYEHSLIQILFNGLAKSSRVKDVSNLGGKLYYFSGKSIGAKQIYCVELKISSGYTISLLGKTFTKTSNSYGKAEHVLQANNTLRRRSKSDDKGDFYVPFQFEGTRHQVTFINASSVSKFETSKVGILSRLLDKFHNQYRMCGIQLKLAEENDWEKLDIKSAMTLKKEHLRKLKKEFKGKKLNIINAIDDDNGSSEFFCRKLQDKIKDIFTDEEKFLKNDKVLNFTIDVSDKEDSEALNLRVIHSKPYYENQKKKDAYRVYKDIPVQHITFEDFPKKTKDSIDGKHKAGDLEDSACIAALNDLLVKFDLTSKKDKSISVVNWESYHYEKDWKFFYCDEKEIEIENKKKIKENHYYFMSINPDGHFEINEVKECDKEYIQYEEIFAMNNMKAERHNRYDEKYRGLVVDSDGNINIIQDTSNFMLPSSDIYTAIKDGVFNRKKEFLEKYFRGCLDIYYKKAIEGNVEYYSVGQIGSGMNTTVERSAKIRKIIPYKKSKLFFRNVLDTMNVTFVRNGQLTIMPFPFKYLREWIELNNEKSDMNH